MHVPLCRSRNIPLELLHKCDKLPVKVDEVKGQCGGVCGLWNLLTRLVLEIRNKREQKVWANIHKQAAKICISMKRGCVNGFSFLVLPYMTPDPSIRLEHPLYPLCFRI